MVVKRSKKVRKQRGSRTYGFGVVHRGSGNRGGFGNAGSGKKAKGKMPRKGLWGNQLMGKSGFKMKGQMIEKIGINIRDLEDRIDTLQAAGIAKEEKGIISVDLSAIGCNILLSSGTPRRKLVIKTRFATQKSVEKIKSAGGNVVLPEAKV